MVIAKQFATTLNIPTQTGRLTAIVNRPALAQRLPEGGYYRRFCIICRDRRLTRTGNRSARLPGFGSYTVDSRNVRSCGPSRQIAAEPPATAASGPSWPHARPRHARSKLRARLRPARSPRADPPHKASLHKARTPPRGRKTPEGRAREGARGMPGFPFFSRK